MGDTRFGILVLQDAPFAELEQRWLASEQLGFDSLFVADHSRDYRDLHGHWFDGWTVLAAIARVTTTIRLGTLVTNPLLRPPVTVAKAAATVDHLSGGRLELGIGTGIAPFDHQAAGVPYWPARERVARFREYVEVVDRLLRSSSESVTFHGRYHGTEDVTLLPPPVQQPRPTLIVGGQSPTVRRVAAERADTWNTHGPFGRSVDDILEITRSQNLELDRWCEEHDRPAASLRRSLLLFEALDPWAAPDRLARIVERFSAAGVSEFVVFWPDDIEQRKIFEHVATHVLPRLRGR